MPKRTMPSIDLSGFRMEAGANGVVEIFLYDDIGPESWGMIGAQTFADALKGVDAKAPVLLHINSLGGSVVEATAIYNLLAKRDNVTVEIDGYACSAASMVAMAGDQIRIAESGMIVIHDPVNICWGNAADMRRAADLLDTFRDQIAGCYAARTGKPAADVAQLMAAETWMNAATAVEKKFADAVMPNKKSKQDDAMNRGAAATVTLHTRLDLTRFKNAPQSLRGAAFNQAATPPHKENESMNMDQFKAFAAENPDAAQPFVKQGEKAGRASASADLKAMLAAFPGDEKFGTDQFLANRTIDEAKTISDQIKAATKAQADAITAKDKQIADLQAKLGGQGGVATAGAAADAAAGAGADPSKIEDPKARAEAEWTVNTAGCQQRFTSKERYVSVRKAELTGKLRVSTPVAPAAPAAA